MYLAEHVCFCYQPKFWNAISRNGFLFVSTDAGRAARCGGPVESEQSPTQTKTDPKVSYISDLNIPPRFVGIALLGFCAPFCENFGRKSVTPISGARALLGELNLGGSTCVLLGRSRAGDELHRDNAAAMPRCVSTSLSGWLENIFFFRLFFSPCKIVSRKQNSFCRVIRAHCLLCGGRALSPT